MGHFLGNIGFTIVVNLRGTKERDKDREHSPESMSWRVGSIHETRSKGMGGYRVRGGAD